MDAQRRLALRPYWRRCCTGFRWHRRFPDSPKTQLREFLTFFVDAFGFPERRRCCFSPEDKILDVYRALYPSGSAGDALEMETFSEELRERYKIDPLPSWREDTTLGDLYELTHLRENLTS